MTRSTPADPSPADPSLVDPSLVDPSLVDPALVDPAVADPALADTAVAELGALIRAVPDFPKPGVVFRDISPLLAGRLRDTILALDALFDAHEWAGIEAIVGVESRGFLLASALAFHRDRPLLLVRKPGKLPPPVEREAYDLEYGRDTLEMGTLLPPRRVLVVDDVIATGGTLGATCALCERAGHTVAGIAALIQLAALNDFRWKATAPRWLFRY